jgi:hypothetical protein
MFVSNAVYAEVYASHVFFLLLAVHLWLRNKQVMAGASFALAFLITPSTVFALPLFIVMRPHRQALLRLGAAALIGATVAVLPNVSDYVFGGRGLLQVGRRSLSMGDTILKEGREVLLSLFACLPFVLRGGVRTLKEEKLRPLGVGIVCLWLVSLLGERFGDVPVQLPTYALLSLVAALGFDSFLTTTAPRERDRYVWLYFGLPLIAAGALTLVVQGAERHVPLRVFLLCMCAIISYNQIASLLMRVLKLGRRGDLVRVAGVVALIVSINGYLAFRGIRNASGDLVSYRDTVLEMDRIASPDYVTVGGWSDGILFEHYVFGTSYTGRWINTEWLLGIWGESEQSEAVEAWRHAIAAGREVWLFEYDAPLFSTLRESGYTIEPYRKIYRARPGNG